MAKALVGLQLYTLRDLTSTDFLGTIRQVAEIGYQAVEFAGFFGVPAKELKAHLADLGLKAPSAHIGLNFNSLSEMEEDLARQIEYAQELGLEYVITPYAPFSPVPTREEVDRIGSFLERASEMVLAAGLRYGYHNHDFEFKQVDGKAIIDHFLERIPADRMVAEFDLGWVHRGGSRPVDYVTRYAGRVPIVHVKDFGEGVSDTEVGAGTVDFESVFRVADQAGIQCYIVEQEQFRGSPLESARISLEYFRAKGLLD